MPFLSNTGPRTSLTTKTKEIKSPIRSYYVVFLMKLSLYILCDLLPPLLSPESFLFHCRYNFCVYVHVEIKLEAEALLTGVLQGEQTHC